MAFGNAENLIDGLYRLAREWLFFEEGREGLVKCRMKPLRLAKEYAGALGVGLGQGEELSAALRGNDASYQKEAEKLFPREIRGRAELVDEVEGEPAAD
jgi:hypothetical protein